MTESNDALMERLRDVLADEEPPLTNHEVRRLRQIVARDDVIVAGGKFGKMFAILVIGLASLIAAGVKIAEYFGAVIRASGKAG